MLARLRTPSSLVREREREREREKERGERGREGEREREERREKERGEREIERDVEYVFLFLNGMTGALAPFSYLVYIE
jgi:hypothetical protein